MEITANELEYQLKQFHGSVLFYSLPICDTRYTEGVQFLAETANAFWLLTDSSVMGKSLLHKSYFITVDFKRLTAKEKEEIGYDAIISYSDGNGLVFTTQKYHLTDFPLDELRLFFVDGTLMLPNEY